MFFVEIFLLLIFTVLCGILLALWRIREQLDRIVDKGALTASSSSTAKPPAA